MSIGLCHLGRIAIGLGLADPVICEHTPVFVQFAFYSVHLIFCFVD
jgi:hypothetical protein